MKNFIKNNLNLVFAFIIGALIAGTSAYATAVMSASDVGYDNTTSGISASNVQEALDQLDQKANYHAVNPAYFGDFSVLKFNSSKTIMASKYLLCINMYNSRYSVACFRNNNWAVEQNHIQDVFYDGTCTWGTNNANIQCSNTKFLCTFQSSGYVSCTYKTNNTWCTVYAGNACNCGT